MAALIGSSAFSVADLAGQRRVNGLRVIKHVQGIVGG
jgi:hypothetical protein